MDDISKMYIDGIEKVLQESSNPEDIPKIRTYLKNEARHIYGIPMKKLKSKIKRYESDFGCLESDTIWEIASDLMDSHVFEKQITAVTILAAYRYRFDGMFVTQAISRWTEKGVIRNWAVADQAALNVVAPIVSGDITIAGHVIEWAKSPFYLLRRSSVAVYAEMELQKEHIIRLFSTVRMLLNDTCEYVWRAAGWAIRNVYNYDKNLFFEFINTECALMPRIMLRNAIEHLEDNKRLSILENSRLKRNRRGKNRGGLRKRACKIEDKT